MKFKPSYLRRFSCLWICVQVYVLWAISLDFLLKLPAKSKIAIAIKKKKEKKKRSISNPYLLVMFYYTAYSIYIKD